jgi:GMP synthase (glutamine-hydrolysing)
MDIEIAVVDASCGDTPAERNLTREIDDSTTAYEASNGEFPSTPTGSVVPYDGVVISGSQTSACDDHDWIHELTSWARSAHRADVPTLGVCWGHQFLAQTLGGRVVDMGEHEFGYRTVQRCSADPLFAGVPDSFTAFETHSDRVAELPAGTVEFARNEYGVQAFRLGSSYGVQFHLVYATSMRNLSIAVAIVVAADTLPAAAVLPIALAYIIQPPLGAVYMHYRRDVVAEGLSAREADARLV